MSEGYAAIRGASPAAAGRQGRTAGRRAAGVWLGLASLALLAAAGLSPTAGWAQVLVTNQDVTSTTSRVLLGSNEAGSTMLAQPFTIPATGPGGSADTGNVTIRRIMLDFATWPAQAEYGSNGIRVYVLASESNHCEGEETSGCYNTLNDAVTNFFSSIPEVRPALTGLEGDPILVPASADVLGEFTPVASDGQMGPNWFEHSGLSLQRDRTYYVLLFQHTGNIEANQSPTWKTVEPATSPTPTDIAWTFDYSARCEASVADGWVYAPAVSEPSKSRSGWIYDVGGQQKGYAHVMAVQGTLNADPVLTIMPPSGGNLDEVEPGDTVTATAVTDANGLSVTNPTITYTWQERPIDSTDEAAWTDISGTSSTTPPARTMGNDDQTKEFRLVTSEFVDDHCYTNTAASAIAKVPQTNNAPTGELTVSGTARVGQQLMAVTGAISDADGPATLAFDYQWWRADDAAGTTNAVEISGATTSTYTLTTDDAGKHVQVVVSYTDARGFDENVSSDWTAVLNSDPMGALTVSSNPPLSDPNDPLRFGQELTAVTTAISDADGPATLMFTYQWRRADDAAGTVNAEEIAGATMSTYTLDMADVERYVQVVASYTDGGGTDESVPSGWMAVKNIAATGMPTISGAPTVGQELTAGPGDIGDTDGLSTGVTYTYQWRRADGYDPETGPTGDEDISGATSSTYTLAMADVGKVIQVVLSFPDEGGSSESRPSAWTAAVNGLPTGTPTVSPADTDTGSGAPTISGTLMVDQELMADTSEIDDPNGLDSPDWRYQWRRADNAADTEGTDIPGATSDTYTPREEDEGKLLHVRVTFTDNDGYTATVRSTWTAAVDRRADTAATGDVAVRGTPQVEEELTADTSAIEDLVNGLTAPNWRYQWRRADNAAGANDADIPGAASAVYTPVEADLGKYLQVTVEFTDDDGYPETKTSGWVGPVEEATTSAETATVRQWASLFGRTVSVQALDAVQQRLGSRSRPQGQASVAGRRVSWTPGSDEDTFARGAVDSWFGNRDPRVLLDTLDGDVRSLVPKSSFAYTRQSREGTFTSLWGRGAYMAFSSEEGGRKVDGGVTTGHVGADWALGRWFVGLSVGHSVGTGDYRDSTGDGDLASSVTGVYPYVGYTLSERVSVWAMTGYGEGGLEVTPTDGETAEADLGVTMGASGVRGELLGEASGGFALAVKADAVTVRVSSDRSGELEGVRSSVNRVRMGLEASGRVAFGYGETLTPVLDIGVLREGGNTGSGTGVDTGIGFIHEMPACGLTIDLRGRTLSLDDASSRDQWGLSGGIQYDAVPSGARGLSMSLDVGYGGSASATGTASLFEMDTFEDLGAGGGSPPAGGRVGAKVGYGLQALESRYASTPRASVGLTESGTDWALGWWLTPAAQWAPDLRGGVEVDGGDGDDVRGVSLRIDARF